MAIRVKLNGLEDIKRLIEEGRIVIHDSARAYVEEVSRYTWDEGPTVLEARAGEDGVFRVEGETAHPDPWGELERLREKLKEQESALEKFIFGRYE